MARSPMMTRCVAGAAVLLLAALAVSDAEAATAAPFRVPRFRPPPPRRAESPNAVPRVGYAPAHLGWQPGRPLISLCQERWRDATLDHFTWAAGDKGRTTFRQRYFLCPNHWGLDDQGKLGPIFFYLGNEADVTLYLNNTGLMWESAPQFRALLVFAEHRYYGKSLPYGKHVRKHMQYLGAEQALADYAELIQELKAEFDATAAPVIGFGGSYGGMLASWMRLKYPHILDGAVAGSAPIWNFEGEVPAFDPLSFAKGVTWDASELGGSIPECADNVRAGWAALLRLGSTPEGRASIRKAVRLCDSATLDTKDDVLSLRGWLAGAWDYMAMGNFPYPSGYILNGQGLLPPFPVRLACQTGMRGVGLTDTQLVEGLAAAAGVYYNYTHSLGCFDSTEGANEDSDQDGDFWSYQYCTEMFMPDAKDGVHDMFWDEPWDPDGVAEWCKDTWGVEPRRLWAQTQWGGRRIDAGSRIVFSNGLLDPWHGGGVLRDVNDALPALIIPEGAHHLDLMFSHPDDPPSVTKVRQQEQELIRQWVALARSGPEPSRTAAALAGRKGRAGSVA